MTHADPVLQVEHLSMRFGGLVAVSDLSFTARRGDITALIGPNGAGKTTVFNCITGFYKPSAGLIRLAHPDGRAFLLERLLNFRVAKLARVARTFQNIRLFPGMTALENLMVAQHNALMRASGLTFLGLIGAPSWRQAEQAAIELARTWLERIGLLDRADLTGALDAIWQRVRRLNRYVEEQAPWTLAKDPERAAELDRVLASLAEALRVVAVLLHPWMPESSGKLLDALGAPELELEGARMQSGRLGAIARLEPLFPKPQA